MRGFGAKAIFGIGLLSAASFGFGASKQIVLGRLGQATRSMGIHRDLSTTSGVYWHVNPDEYLVVNSTKYSKWLSVLLSNGYRGYVPRDSISVMPFNVVKTVQEGATAGYGEGYEVASSALQYLGTKYVWGGNSLTNGIDCSGFVKKLFGKIGIDLPRTAAEQSLVGEPIYRYEDLQTGDRLYFWEAKKNKIGHTGIYIGNGQFVHSSMNHHGVAVDYLSANWKRILVAARR